MNLSYKYRLQLTQEAVLKASNRKIEIVNETECKDDLVQDMIDVLTSFCAGLYGKRAAKNRAMRALEATKDEGV